MESVSDKGEYPRFDPLMYFVWRYIGQSWGPWQFFTGTVVRSFRLNNVVTNFNAFRGNPYNSLNNFLGVS